MTFEQAKELGNIIRITSIDGIKLSVDKKYMPSRKNVQIENGKIVSESKRG
jgi:hypothetical protein